MAICGFGKISLHEASTGKLLHRFDDKEGHIRSASWSAGGKELVTCNLIQKTITIWNVESGLSKLTWDAQGHVNTCSYDPQGRWIASGDLAGNITLWNAADGKKIRALSGHTRAVHRLRFSPDGARLVSSSEDGTLRIWNPEAARARSIVEVTNSYPLISPSFDFDRSGRFIIVSANNGLTYILKIH
jgi:WD40 repeat protein